MNHAGCCAYVPPHVLDRLSRKGLDPARMSVHVSSHKRRKRLELTRAASPDTLMLSGVGEAGPAQGERIVYDSKHTWEQRVGTPVRGEGDPATADESVDNAYDYAGLVRQYYQELLNRNSIDNAGMPLILNVHFGVDYMNAFWDGDEMTFGDGDGEIFIDFTKSLDVVAHELTHGVTQFTAGLEYSNQSGALNESFSDVFGAAVTQWHLGQSAADADWLVGDEIMGPKLYGEALRSLAAPGSAYDHPLLGHDPQPAHMDDYYTGPDDNGGVHINSGIPNKVFYLTAMDIGTDKAALIWYHALQKLWPTADFNDAVEVIVEAARVLVKNGQAPAGSTQTVRAAFKTVGLPH
jgi:Zn-dependent metalloprotease